MRLEIPALYRLDFGSSNWGWHKMTDLRTAVCNLLERSPFEQMTAEQIGQKFKYLNPKKYDLFFWANERTGMIDPFVITKIDWNDPDLMVPAEWGMRVIRAIKEEINNSVQGGVLR